MTQLSWHHYRSNVALALLCACLAYLPPSLLEGRQFRSFAPIATPERIPEDAKRIEKFKPVSRELVLRSVNALISAWNTGQLDDLLSSERFYGRDELLDTMSVDVPPDARIHVQSVSGISTLEQYNQARNGLPRQISIVSATVSTQLEFTDINAGFVRLEGRNEFIMEIEQPTTEDAR